MSVGKNGRILGAMAIEMIRGTGVCLCAWTYAELGISGYLLEAGGWRQSFAVDGTGERRQARVVTAKQGSFSPWATKEEEEVVDNKFWTGPTNNHSQPVLTSPVYKPGKVAVVLSGRQAGKKVVVIQQRDEGTKERPYPHAIVAGIER